MAQAHYASVERGNESNPHDEWSDTACGLEMESGLTDNWQYVTCKNCLKRKVAFEAERQMHISSSF